MDNADAVITSSAELRGLLGETHPLNRAKSISALDIHCRRFLELSSFCTIASCSGSGKMDVSPKGDPPGFVRVLDDHTIVIPERPGNRRADTFTNVLENPAVGLIFLVPGVDETLRVNGTASLSVDQTLLDTMKVDDKAPKLALIVHVEEAFIHCGKALKRGSLWDASKHVKDRGGLPTMGELLHAHGRGDEHGLTCDRLVEIADNDYNNNVY